MNRHNFIRRALKQHVLLLKYLHKYDTHLSTNGSMVSSHLPCCAASPAHSAIAGLRDCGSLKISASLHVKHRKTIEKYSSYRRTYLGMSEGYLLIAALNIL